MRSGTSTCHHAKAYSCFLKLFSFINRKSGHTDKDPSKILLKHSVLRLDLQIWLTGHEWRIHVTAAVLDYAMIAD
jgi:hypothetical protein